MGLARSRSSGPDARLKLTIDGDDIRIENLGKLISIRAGKHELVVERDGLRAETQKFEINRGQEKVLVVTYSQPAESGEVRRARAEISGAIADVRKALSPETNSSGAGLPSKAAPRPLAPAAPASASPRVVPEFITTVAGRMKLKLIPAGDFMMGSDDGQGEQGEFDGHPRHSVRITQPFYLGVHEVTQGEYQAVMGSNPSYFSSGGRGKDKVAGVSTDAHPVDTVSWL